MGQAPDEKKVLAAAREARLRYVTDRGPGIRRERHGKRFRYFTDQRRRVKGPEVERIESLAIPPAWEKVWICPLAHGHLQATGLDARGRKQYRYHAEWHAVRTRTNFHSLIAFAAALPGIRRQVARDLRRPGLPREKVVAAAVSLMEHTHIRVGNAEYAEENQSFGLSTLRDRHVEVRGDRIQLRFKGKSGQFHQIHLNNAHLARIVKHCQDLPGYELFQYFDEQGEVRDLTSDHINDYLKAIAGEEFTAKDFRTWSGTVAAAVFLRAHPCPVGKKPTKAGVIAAFDAAAEALGNTRAVCRKHYVHPAVCAAYLDGTLASFFNGPTTGGPRAGLKPEERAVLRLLKHADGRKGTSPRAAEGNGGH